MISPHKYLDLNLSLLNMGGVILTIIKENGVIKYDELLDKVILARGDNAAGVFIPALGFLYIMGKIDYNKDMDVIEYIQ
jgi:hypothetical protein